MGRSLIVEADGGSRGNPGIAAGGAVVVDAATG
jgi:ribonuclease HI